MILNNETGIVDIDEPESMDMAGILAMVKEVGTEGLTEAEYRVFEDAKRLSNFAPGEWNENLLDRVSETEQGIIASEIWKWVNWDEISREKWSAREQAGIRMMGVTDEPELPDDSLRFGGMATVVHPGFMQAIEEFWARSLVDLFPPEGPVKAIPLGRTSDEREAQAQRVADFMNWQYTERMPGAFDEWSRLLLRLPMSGSMFTKIYYDTEEETARVIAVEPADFLVPYSCNDLLSSPRYTHRMWTASHIVKARMESGFYSDKPLVFATEANYPETRRVIEDAEGREPTLFVEDRRHCILECHCYRAIPELNASEGVNPDTMLPLVITIDRDSQKLLAIRRNWKEGDARRNKRLWFSHKKFLPGLGFYGFGLPHIMAGLSRAQTGALRAILDRAGIENLSGGFVTSDVRIPEGGPLAMGEWRQVQATSDELSRAFFPRPTAPASDILYKLLEWMDEKQQRLMSTTEVEVGDANNNAPVGTTLALIEQGAKKETAIRQGLHVANAEEFKILAALNAEFLPEVYPYETDGKDAYVMRDDFDDRVDVRPVSDPRLGTQTQRISQQQALLQLAQMAPHLYNLREIHKRMLEALRVQDIDLVLPDRSKPLRMDPIQENMAMLTGKPVQVLPDQLHQAHILVHQQWFASLDPGFQQPLQGAFMAHLAEHMAWEYRNTLEARMGLPMPFPGVMTDDPKDDQDLPPEVDNQIALMTAQFLQGVQLQQQQVQMQEQQVLQAQQQDQQAQIAQQEQAVKDEEFERDQARLDAEAQAEIERNSLIAQAEREQAALDSEAERIRQREEEYPER
jgi:hypothetical protein